MRNKFLFTGLLTAAFALGAVSGQILSPAAQAQTAGAVLPAEMLQEFAEVYGLIRKNYVEETPPGELIENALRGMVSSLDPHSSFLDESEFENFQRSLTSEEYSGVGIYIGKRDDWVEVISPIYDTPAFRANIKSGDLILKIDGVSTQGMEIEEAVNRMRGKTDTLLSLEVLPIAGGAARKVEVIRQKIATPSVLASLLEDGYGYLRVTHFKDKTAADFAKNINGLYEQNGAPLKGILLDLRDNPGGYLNAGIAVASAFLPNGATVVADQGRMRGEHVFVANRSDHNPDLANIDDVLATPMVALVNNGSASAAEIVAGALQDHRRAVILGSRTYGKASVQTLHRLSSSNGKSSLRLTTARYFTPLGRNIQARGITPDIVVRQAEKVEEADEEGVTFRESDVSGHLENDSAPAEKADEDNPFAVVRPPFIAEEDFQYDQAILALKALSIQQRRQ